MKVAVLEVFNQTHKACRRGPNKLVGSILMCASYRRGPAFFVDCISHFVARNDSEGARGGGMMKLILHWILCCHAYAH